MAVTYRSSPLSTMPGKYHCFCAKCGNEMSKDCEARLRSHEHCQTIAYIISQSSEVIKILVGPEECEIICHKAALGFYSDFFDAAFYGGMTETVDGETKLGIATFVSWVYSGQVHSPVSAEELWILGDRLGSPLFCNEIIHFMFGLYGTCRESAGRWLSARSMDLIHEKTSDNSRLRLFALDLLQDSGPLCPRAVQNMAKHLGDNSYEEDWRDLIKRGGELILTMVLEISFYKVNYDDPDYNYDDDDDEDDNSECVTPWKPSNQKKYLLPVTERTVQEYVMGKNLSVVETRRRN